MHRDRTITVVLISVIILLVLVKYHSKATTDNVIYDPETKIVNLDSLTLKQKIAQMIVVYGIPENKDEFQRLLIGGVHLGAKESKDDYITAIKHFQTNSTIPLFITVDLEGCINPFENFVNFTTFKDVKDETEAYALGRAQGKILKEIGFTTNFSPVVDLEDTIWGCRAFTGNPSEIVTKANAYIDGLKEFDIIASAKHYPGKTLIIQDTHKYEVFATIDDNDLYPFKATIQHNVSAVMVSHLIVKGRLDSGERPSTISKEIVQNLKKDYSGLIITDEVGMLGLRNRYSDIRNMYTDLFKADNDIVLYFSSNTNDINRMIDTVAIAVQTGEISESRIDKSVVKILTAKGLSVN